MESPARIKELLSPQNPDFSKCDSYMTRQNTLLKGISQAKQTYSVKEDPESLITAYERVLIDPNEPLQSEEHISELIALYLINRQNDKAWGFLNSLLHSKTYPLDKIRGAQARILKAEKKDIDAVEKYLQAHLASSIGSSSFSKTVFLSDISLSAKRLKWDMKTIRDLTRILTVQILRKDADEDSLVLKYRTYLEKHGFTCNK